ncbi:MAG: T9SS type A sorting domain-containing protein [Chitinophagaceae bacterium]|nr:T9SS type A sorting domain-containing protein [Chitinophagaceae bacterium]
MYIKNLQPALTNSSSYLDVVADKIGKLTIKVLNVQGWVAKKVIAEVEEGKQQLDLNLNDLNSGIYILNAFLGDVFIKSIRFVKQ